MTKRAFRLAYDGRPFHGFQRQPDVPTVEGALFEALRELSVCDREPSGYSAAGRTDAGVSAVAQTVAFHCPEWCSPRALDAELPSSVRTWAAADVPDGFHATHDAERRTYTYHLYAPDVDDGRVREAAATLAGEHDFHNLSLADEGTVRDVSIDLTREDRFLDVTVSSDGFPRGFVRKLVGLLRAVGTGEVPPARVDRVVSSEPTDGPQGIPLAPAVPLVLVGVDYDVAFEPDDRAVANASERFEDLRIEHATRERVAGSIRAAIERTDD